MPKSTYSSCEVVEFASINLRNVFKTVWALSLNFLIVTSEHPISDFKHFNAGKTGNLISFTGLYLIKSDIDKILPVIKINQCIKRELNFLCNFLNLCIQKELGEWEIFYCYYKKYYLSKIKYIYKLSYKSNRNISSSSYLPAKLLYVYCLYT